MLTLIQRGTFPGLDHSECPQAQRFIYLNIEFFKFSLLTWICINLNFKYKAYKKLIIYRPNASTFDQAKDLFTYNFSDYMFLYALDFFIQSYWTLILALVLFSGISTCWSGGSCLNLGCGGAVPDASRGREASQLAQTIRSSWPTAPIIVFK